MSIGARGGLSSVGRDGSDGLPRAAAPVPAQGWRIAVALTVTTLMTFAPWPALAETPASFSDRWWPVPAWTASITARDPSQDKSPDRYQDKGPQLAARSEPLPATSRPASIARAADGLASFYGTGTETASGERFNPRAMTAAHRTLPFGTRVRVTNVASGRTVTVRINDRGPFIPGRVIDVSQAAAEELGMVGRGVTKVKLDVVQ